MKKLNLPNEIYVPNTKSGTAGFDKLVIDNIIETAWSTWVYYTNTRTKQKKQFRVVEGKIKSSYIKVFMKLPEYFAWRLNNGKDRFKNFEHEFNNIQEKYPEYFI